MSSVPGSSTGTSSFVAPSTSKPCSSTPLYRRAARPPCPPPGFGPPPGFSTMMIGRVRSKQDMEAGALNEKILNFNETTPTKELLYYIDQRELLSIASIAIIVRIVTPRILNKTCANGSERETAKLALIHLIPTTLDKLQKCRSLHTLSALVENYSLLLPLFEKDYEGKELVYTLLNAIKDISFEKTFHLSEYAALSRSFANAPMMRFEQKESILVEIAKKILGETDRGLLQFTVRELAMLANAYGKVSINDPNSAKIIAQLFEDMACVIVESKSILIRQFTGQGIAMLLNGFSKVKAFKPKPESSIKEMFREFARYIVEMPGSIGDFFTPTEFAMILNAYKNGFTTEWFKDPEFDEIVCKLFELMADEINNMGCAYRREFKPKEVAMIVHAYSKCSKENINRTAVSQDQITTLLKNISLLVLDPHTQILDKSTSQGLSMLARGFDKISFRIPHLEETRRSILLKIADHILSPYKRTPRFKIQELPKIAIAYRRGNSKDPELFRVQQPILYRIATIFMDTSRKYRETLTAKELSSLVYSWSQLKNLSHGQNLCIENCFKLSTQVLLHRPLQNFTSNDLISVVVGCAKIHVYNGKEKERVRQLLFKVADTILYSSEIKPAIIARLANSFARLGIVEDYTKNIMRYFSERLQSVGAVDSHDVKSIILFLHSWMIIGGVEILDLERLITRINTHDLNFNSRHQLYQIHEHCHRVLGWDLSFWTDRHAFLKNMNQEVTSSKLHMEVFHALASRIRIDESVNEREIGPYHCDIVVEKTVIEVNGPTHIAFPGKDFLKRAYLKSLGYDLIEVAYLDWRKNPDLQIERMVKALEKYAL